jgi:hypothetical protein
MMLGAMWGMFAAAERFRATAQTIEVPASVALREPAPSRHARA